MTPAPRIALASIEPSKTNPRQHFDQAKLDELADSIKRHDVIQPILVRPNGKAGHYELVAGERRYRAAKAAGLADIPATVRDLSDSEVLEIQVIENLQREDLAPLEEALGYDRLLKCKPTGVDVLIGPKWTVDEIAAKVGRSKAYVYAKLKLLALCPEARKALEAAAISESIALLVARIPVHDLQRQAVKDVTDKRWSGEPMSFREASAHIQRQFMLRLAQAPFDVKRIYFVDAKSAKPIATACFECPKRTGNQPELFADVTDADVCTDPVCFGKKREAQRAVEREEKIAAGYQVVTGKAAEKILPNTYSAPAGGYVRLDDRHPRDGKNRTYRQIIGKEAPKGTLVEVPDQYGEGVHVVEVAKLEELKPLLKGKLAKAGAASGGAREKKQSADDLYRDRLFVEIVKKLPLTLGTYELQLIAQNAVDMASSRDLLADLVAPRKDGKKHDYASARKALDVAKLPPGQLCRLIVAVQIDEDGYNEKAMAEHAKRYKVDAAKLKKAIAEEAKAEVAKKPAAKKKAKA